MIHTSKSTVTVWHSEGVSSSERELLMSVKLHWDIFLHSWFVDLVVSSSGTRGYCSTHSRLDVNKSHPLPPLPLLCHLQHQRRHLETSGFRLMEVKRRRAPLYLLFQLCQLCRQCVHHFHCCSQFVLQHPHLILLSIAIGYHQRHCLHPWEPVQVVVLQQKEKLATSGHWPT